MSIRLAIYGYGNIGRGVEAAVTKCPDIELCGVFTRRAPETVQLRTPGVPVYNAADAEKYKDEFDVVILCGGSATDLPAQTPAMAKLFNVVDSFDTHAKIPQHFAAVDAAAKESGKVAVISVGWDPGMFSVSRLYASSILPKGQSYTFWGRGVSQGHSDAVRRIEGVLDARQYTVPVPAAVELVRSGAQPQFTTRQKHTREVYVVAAEGADRERIIKEIKTMPNYFDEYDTTVTFITAGEMKEKHSNLPHGGTVFHSGTSGINDEHSHIIEYSLKLDSNPEFTAGVLVAYARAAVKLAAEGHTGCKTVFDVAPGYLSPMTAEELRAKML
ncbi:MAG: diaminopimelate dehydrogenase [Oscillospiraceae bacterium]|nr:diaminopimelate dehydrogenase [Oscillospiraceae bacterium]